MHIVQRFQSTVQLFFNPVNDSVDISMYLYPNHLPKLIHVKRGTFVTLLVPFILEDFYLLMASVSLDFVSFTFEGSYILFWTLAPQFSKLV